MLVEFIRACSTGDEKLAESILRGVTPDSHKVTNVFLRANLILKKVELEQQPKQVKGTIKRAIKQHDLDTFYRFYFKGVDLKGKFLIHRALEEGQNKMLEALLIARLDPNEKDSDGNTPLYLAASRANLEAVWLLLRFGATLEPHIFMMIKEACDPLHISQAERWLCAGAVLSWAAESITGSHSLALAINIIASASLLYNHVPSMPVVGAISCLELIPGVNYVVKLAKTACVVASAFTGLRAAYTHYTERPSQAMQKAVVHLVNTTQSLKTVSDSVRIEYGESQFIKTALEKGLNPADADGYSDWTCDTFEKLFRKEALTCHSDKGGDCQMALVAARQFWRDFCEKSVEPPAKEAVLTKLLSKC